MTEENEIGLLVSKFQSLSKKEQNNFLEPLFKKMDRNNVADVLSGKKLVNEEKQFKEGDYVLIPITISSWPKLDKSYYQENNLLINDSYIRVKVERFDLISQNYLHLKMVTEGSNGKETIVEVYDSYVPKQDQFKIIS